MNFIFKAALSLVMIWVAFAIVNSGLGYFFRIIEEWNLFWFITTSLIALSLCKIISQFSSLAISWPTRSLYSLTQIRAMKWILLIIGWGISAFNNLMTFHVVDFSQTRPFIVGAVVIIANCFIPWEVHSRIQPLEEGASEGEKAAINTVEIASRLASLVNNGSKSYEEAMGDIQIMRDGHYINDMEGRMITILVQKQTGR